MTVKHFASTALRAVRTGLVSTAIFQFAVGSAFAQAADASSHDADTSTPIKHVIVIIGENRSFDHVFATYVPKKGQTVWNLLSEGIVKADGTPGPNFPLAEQKHADVRSSDGFLLSPPAAGTFLGNVLPAPLNGGPTDSYVNT
jgi:phospholipase C